MSRVAKGDVYAAMERAAQNILKAGGDDGRVSRADIKAHLDTLDGTERALTDIFYRFIDHRDYVPGATVTKTDVQKALGYAREKLINKYDLNQNGLSKSEISRMSRTGKLAVQLAKEMKLEGLPREVGSIELSKALESKAEGLQYISESDYPYEAVHLPNAAGKDGQFDAKNFVQALGLPADKEIYSVETPDDFFQLYQDPDGYGDNPAEARKYADLENTMRSELSDLKFIQLDGEDKVEGDVYIVGTAKDGSVVGLKSSRIWT